MGAITVLILSSLLLPMKPSTTPTNAQVLYRHVPDQAEFVVGVDFAAFVPQVFQNIQNIGQQPFIAQNRRTARMYRRTMRRFLRNLKGMKRQFGVDPLKDIKTITISMQTNPQRRRRRYYRPKPLVLFSLQGNFPPESQSKILRALGLRDTTPVEQGNFRIYWNKRKNRPSLAWHDQGILFGNAPLLRGALTRENQTAPAKGSIARMMIDKHQTQSMFSLGARVAPRWKRMIKRQIGPIYGLLGQHTTHLHAAMLYKGMSLNLRTTDAQNAKRMQIVLDGLGTLLIGTQHATKGLVKIFDGYLDPNDTKLPPILRQMAQHKQSFFQLIQRRMAKQGAKHSTSVQGNWVQLRTPSRMTGVLMGSGLVGFLALMPQRARVSKMASSPSSPPRAVRAAPALPPAKSDSTRSSRSPSARVARVAPSVRVARSVRRPTTMKPHQRYMVRQVFPAISKHKKTVNACYHSYKGPEKLPLQGALVIGGFSIKNDGSVDPQSVKLTRTQLQIKEINQCIVKTIAGWKFPPHTLPKPMHMQYPFFLR